MTSSVVNAGIQVFMSLCKPRCVCLCEYVDLHVNVCVCVCEYVD